MSLCKAIAFARLVVNPFRRLMLHVNKVMTPLWASTLPSYVRWTQIPCEVGRSPVDLCALSKAGRIPFEKSPV